MALPCSSRATGHPGRSVLSVDGRLAAAVGLARFPSNYQPPDHVWLFRSIAGWSVFTVSRHERWHDDGSENLSACVARASVQIFDSVDALRSTIRRLYGDSGWGDLLDRAAENDDELFQLWAPGAFQRDLLRATFHRADLVAPGGALCRVRLEEVAGEVVDHLEAAGFQVRAMATPNRAHPGGEADVVAFGIVRRYGWEADIVARIDPAGEIYVRLDEEDDEDESALRPLDDDDD